MILVVLGTQDKEFPRLLEAVEKQIKNGTIKEKVMVQAGQTKYTSDCMEIFDLLPAPEFNKLMDKASLIITHGGAGSILNALKKNKKVIAAARLAEYREHHNDHQKQIIGEFVKQGYILELDNFDDLGKVIEKSKKFKQKKFVSNTDNMIKLIENYIEDTDNTSWFNKYYEVLSYLFFGGCTTLINILTFYILRVLNVELFLSNAIAWLVGVVFAFVTNKLFVFESKGNFVKESISFVIVRLVSLGFDMLSMYLLISVLNANELLSKIIANVIVIILNYVFSKLFVFKKQR